jgi:hypothetical protein
MDIDERDSSAAAKKTGQTFQALFIALTETSSRSGLQIHCIHIEHGRDHMRSEQSL